jgi:hypothetical protein
MGQHCPIKCTSFSSERENTALKWAFMLNHTPAAAETRNLIGRILKVNQLPCHEGKKHK